MENYSSWGIIVLSFFAFGCIFPTIIVAALLVFSVRWINKLVTPNPIALKQKLNHLRLNNPGLTDDQLVMKIINTEAFKAGLIGALTGLGGLPILPVALPIDFALSAKIQASLIHFIAYVYAPYESEADLKLKTVAIMAGGEAMKAANKAIQAAARRLVIGLLARAVGKSILKVIPVIGAGIGFGFNWYTTQSMGQLTVKWYKNEFRPPSMQLVRSQVIRVRNTTVDKAKGVRAQLTSGTGGSVQTVTPNINSNIKRLGSGVRKDDDEIENTLTKSVDESNF